MSRSGYYEDLDNWDLIRWRGSVASAIRGKRGQQFFRDLIAALDAMPEKRLIAGELETPTGEVCAMGCVGRARGIDMKNLDPGEPEDVAQVFNIAPCLAQEIAYQNDEAVSWRESDEHRWQWIRQWASEQLRKSDPDPQAGGEGRAE